MPDNTFRFVIDGQSIETSGEETILEIAKKNSIVIPHLCFKEGYKPDGNCRSCMVEIRGERVLAPACCRFPIDGMEVTTSSQRVRLNQHLVLELLEADLGGKVLEKEERPSELKLWMKHLKITKNRFPLREHSADAIDTTNPAIKVDLNQCIKCTRCLRACRDEQANDVIGLAERGSSTKIIFDIHDQLGDSSCVTCGECVQACPTDALTSKTVPEKINPNKTVDSVCPYCGVGCLLKFNIFENKIASVTGQNGPSNESRLCVKGRYGFDYIHHKDRLTRPLVRLADAQKTSDLIDQRDILNYFRETSWEEALNIAAKGFSQIKEEFGPRALAGLGSAKGSNEEAYLFQKLIRTGFGTNNVDHCTRLCHASSVAAMLEILGSAAVSNQVSDVLKAEVAIVIGAKPTVNHPVAATFMKNAAKNGTKIVVIDPYRSELTRHAEYFFQLTPDTDVALLNSMMHVIIEEKLYDIEFINKRTLDFEKLRNCVKSYSPKKVAPICGVTAQEIEAVARLYANAKNAMIFWGMGISQHVHGTDNARCLISLALLCGQIGRSGTGIHPLRGQNNVQGASDSGLIPMVYPNYLAVNDKTNQNRFEHLWNVSLDPEPGLTVTEMTQSALHRGIRGMYIMGENPAMSDPDLNHARTAFSQLDHLVVQDIFFTETAGFADVVFPASAFPEKTGSFTNTDRRVQIGRQALDPPGDAKQDIWIIENLARKLGLNWNYASVQEIFNELRLANDSISGISWESLNKHNSLTYPYNADEHKSESVLFQHNFPTPSGKARFIPVNYTKADELPCESFPYILITGRQLEHWHTGSMTSRARVLSTLEPVPVISLNPTDIKELGLSEDETVIIESRRGRISSKIRADSRIQPQTVFMAFCYRDAAINLLTNSAMDPIGKIPEFKFCAVQVRPEG